MAPISQLSSLLAALKTTKSHAQGSQEARLMTLAYSAPISFERSFRRLQASLIAKEERLRDLYAASKARARQEFRELVHGTALGDSEQPAVTRQAVTAAPPSQEQLDTMYGSDGWLRSTVLSVIGNASHAFMHRANTVHVEGGENMRQAMARMPGQALVTVSNHVAALDDPLVVASIVPPELYSQPAALRWTLCATDRCFKYASLVPFFTAAKVLPVQRGGGFQQPGMVAAEKRLAQGDWVHIFPEGTRSREPSQLGPVRKGVGRLVAAAAAAAPPGTPAPMVVPFVHAGMERIMPVGSKLPTIGNHVHVLVGEPIPMDDLLAAATERLCSDEQLYAAITSRVEHHMQRLHRQVQRLAAGQSAETALQQESAAGLGAAAAKPWWPQVFPQSGTAGLFWGSLQQRQWEHMAFGMWHRVWAGRIAALEAEEARMAV